MGRGERSSGLGLVATVLGRSGAALRPWRTVYEYRNPARHSLHPGGAGLAGVVQVERVDGDRAHRTILRRDSLQPVAERTVSRYSRDMWSPDGRYLIAESIAEHHITAYDVRSWRAVAECHGYSLLAWAAEPNTMVLGSPRGDAYWLAPMDGGGRMVALPFHEGAPLSLVRVDSAAGSALYATSQQLIAANLNTGDRAVLATGVHGVNLSPDGNVALVQYADDLAVVDAHSGAERRFGYGRLGAAVGQVGSWSRDGRWHAALAGTACQLVVSDRTGNTSTFTPPQSCRLNFAARPKPLAWDERSERVYFTFYAGRIDAEHGWLGMYEPATQQGNVYRLDSPYVTWWPDGSGFLLLRAGDPNRYEDYRWPTR